MEYLVSHIDELEVKKGEEGGGEGRGGGECKRQEGIKGINVWEKGLEIWKNMKKDTKSEKKD